MARRRQEPVCGKFSQVDNEPAIDAASIAGKNRSRRAYVHGTERLQHTYMGRAWRRITYYYWACCTRGGPHRVPGLYRFKDTRTEVMRNPRSVEAPASSPCALALSNASAILCMHAVTHTTTSSYVAAEQYV